MGQVYLILRHPKYRIPMSVSGSNGLWPSVRGIQEIDQ